MANPFEDCSPLHGAKEHSSSSILLRTNLLNVAVFLWPTEWGFGEWGRSPHLASWGFEKWSLSVVVSWWRRIHWKVINWLNRGSLRDVIRFGDVLYPFIRQGYIQQKGRLFFQMDLKKKFLILTRRMHCTLEIYSNPEFSWIIPNYPENLHQYILC